MALLTRGMHLDGLADTADGLGSRKPARGALEIMRKSDIGPFGVASIVLMLLVQVSAAAQLLSRDYGANYVVAAVVASRVVLPLICWRQVPGARGEGLGSMVAGSVGVLQLGVGLALGAGLVTAFAVPTGNAWVAIVLAGITVGCLFCWDCVQRFGGITGDVLGACVEVTFTASLLAMTLFR